MEGERFTQNLLSLQQHLLNFAYSLTKNKDDAEDLLQETSLRAIKNQEKFIEGSNFKAWLFTIMKHVFINDYRRVTANQCVDIQTAKIDVEQDAYTGGYLVIESSYDLRLVMELVDQMDDSFKIPFNLFLQGYKYEEIAEQMGVPLGTVKNKLFLTRKRLKQQLFARALFED